MDDCSRLGQVIRSSITNVAINESASAEQATKAAEKARYLSATPNSRRKGAQRRLSEVSQVKRSLALDRSHLNRHTLCARLSANSDPGLMFVCLK